MQAAEEIKRETVIKEPDRSNLMTPSMIENYMDEHFDEYTTFEKNHISFQDPLKYISVSTELRDKNESMDKGFVDNELFGATRERNMSMPLVIN